MMLAVILGIVWLLLALVALAFMAGASFLNDRYDSPEDKNSDNYSEGE